MGIKEPRCPVCFSKSVSAGPQRSERRNKISYRLAYLTRYCPSCRIVFSYSKLKALYYTVNKKAHSELRAKRKSKPTAFNRSEHQAHTFRPAFVGKYTSCQITGSDFKEEQVAVRKNSNNDTPIDPPPAQGAFAIQAGKGSSGFYFNLNIGSSISQAVKDSVANVGKLLTPSSERRTPRRSNKISSKRFRKDLSRLKRNTG